MGANTIMLVFPPPARSIRTLYKPVGITTVLPLGIAYLAAVMTRRGFDVVVVDMAVENLRGPDIRELCERHQPAVVGITSMVSNHNNGMRVAAIVKQCCPDTHVVMGGPHATFVVGETLRSGVVDVVCNLESEQTLPELMECLLGGQDLSGVRGISMLRDDDVITTPPRPLIADLDSIPFPARNLFPLSKYRTRAGAAYVISGRGCPFSCAFCSAAAMYGKRYRSRSPENVLAEIGELRHRYGFSSFIFADDTFTVNRKRVEAICRGLIDERWNMTWACEARVDTVDTDLLRLLRESGCNTVQYGVESGDDRILREVGKGITCDMVVSAVQSAVQEGMTVECSLIVGHYCDTEDTIASTLDFARRLLALAQGDAIVKTKISMLTPFPGTKLYDRAEEFGIDLHTRNWDRYDFATVVMSTRNLSEDRLKYWYDKAWDLQREAILSHGDMLSYWNFEPYAAGASTGGREV